MLPFPVKGVAAAERGGDTGNKGVRAVGDARAGTGGRPASCGGPRIEAPVPVQEGPGLDPPCQTEMREWRNPCLAAGAANDFAGEEEAHAWGLAPTPRGMTQVIALPEPIGRGRSRPGFGAPQSHGRFVRLDRLKRQKCRAKRRPPAERRVEGRHPSRRRVPLRIIDRAPDRLWHQPGAAREPP